MILYLLALFLFFGEFAYFVGVGAELLVFGLRPGHSVENGVSLIKSLLTD